MYTRPRFKSPMLAGIALAAALTTGSAMAGTGAARAISTTASPVQGLVLPSATTPTSIAFNVAGVFSYDEFLDTDNQVFALNVGTNAQIVSVTWTAATIAADAPSYLSEATLAFTNNAITDGVLLNVGIADDAPGTATYNGTVDLVAQGLSFKVDADGVLRLEFFESYDDYPDAADAQWLSGTLTFGVAAVPEPGTYGLMALGLDGVGFVARRRRTQA